MAARRQPIFKSSTRAAISERPSQHSSWTITRPVTMPTPVTSHFSLVPAPSQAGLTWDLLVALLLAGEIIAWVASRPSRREIRSVAPCRRSTHPLPALSKPVGLRSFLIDWAPPETASALGFQRVLLAAASCTSHELLSTTCDATDDIATVLFWCSANRQNTPKY